MVGNKKVWAGILILELVVAGAGVAYAQWGGSDSGKKKDLIILSDVERRTLQDTVTLTGTLARQELRKVTAVAQGRVSGVLLWNLNRGLDIARELIAAPGPFRKQDLAGKIRG